LIPASIEKAAIMPCSVNAIRNGVQGFDDAEAVRRSESNILQWMKYLPEDCITRMIEMGWDVTT
jgi:hypothetical protein